MKIIQKYWLIIILGILAIASIVFKILLPTQVAPSENNWQGIEPGKSNQKQVEKSLGSPLKKEELNNEVTYYYPYTEQNWPTKLRVGKDDSNVKFIETYFPPPEQDYKYFTEKFGNADKVLFGPHSQMGFSVYIYLQRGIALVANPESNLVFEVWYFAPTTLEQFKIISGIELTEEPLKQF